MTQPAENAELRPETLLAYTAHIGAAEAEVEAGCMKTGSF